VEYIDDLALNVWQCMHFDDADRNCNFPVRSPSSSDPAKTVRGTMSSCGAPNQGKIYAFAIVPTYIPTATHTPTDFVRQNVQWIILGVVLGLGVMMAIFYVGSRLWRYRQKYHKERKAVADLEEKVKDMTTLGATAVNLDGDVEMVENPMVIQMRELQKAYDANELKLKAANAEQRQLQAGERQNQLRTMEDDRVRLQNELAQLKAKYEEEHKANEARELELMQRQAAQQAIASNPQTAAAIAGPVRTTFEPTRPKQKQRESH